MEDKSQKLVYQGSLPEGIIFYEWAFSNDKEKEKLTFQIFKNDKEFNSFETYQVLPELLDIIHKVATCGYGCRGGPHKIEYITGRTFNLSLASVKLLRIGLYDEAFTLIRSITEIINLFALFETDPDSFNEWCKIVDSERIRYFSPKKVRCKLEDHKVSPPISREYYSKLCETAVHVNPSTKPQGNNHLETPYVGGKVFKEQAIAALNDLANNLALLASLALKFCVDENIQNKETDRINLLKTKIGKLSLLNIEYYLDKNKNCS